MKNENVIELGDEVKDIVSGFEGVVTSSTEFLNGCRRVCVTPPVDKDGKEPPNGHFDVEQLQILQKAKVKRRPAVTNLEQSTSALTGGEREDPPARSNY